MEFKISVDDLTKLNEDKDMEGLASRGGVCGLADILCVDIQNGLSTTGTGLDGVAAHCTAFGANTYKEVPPKNFFLLVWQNLQDTIILILMAAALVSTILGAALPESRAENEWLEGVAIWIAVVAVTAVGAGNDWSKDRQFRKLNSAKDVIDVNVLRNGKTDQIKNHEVVVGDVLLLEQGNKVIADCVVLDSQGLVLDEASLTGESDPIKKNEQDPWVRSGTQVSEGSGKVLVLAVGERSEWGKTMSLITSAEEEQTPLQAKLDSLATAIGWFGMAVAASCFIALLIKWCVENNGFPISKINDNGPIQFFLYSVTIIVVAIPEGLPLAVTISLAYSMKKMMKDNNFVRHLSACETMGGATAICSDKTGTLTENRMTVTEGWFFGTKLDRMADGAPPLRQDDITLFVDIAAVTSTAFLKDEVKDGKPVVGFSGNRTDCALLLLLRRWGYDYDKIRKDHEATKIRIFNFTSDTKMASFIETHKNGYRVYNKGAAEWVLQRCEFEYNQQGEVVPMTAASRAKLLDIVTEMAKRGLRCICLTFRDMPEDPSRPADWKQDANYQNHDLTACAIVGIKDPVRQEVPDAVSKCKAAGITVRMVTGDNIHTATHIARECGILFEEDHTCMEGPTFRTLSQEELLPLIPKLRVLARSSPEDKLTLVNFLKQNCKDVVAVTGDGTNDAPALKASDVGLAMGIAGTEVAKEAADIVIMDDNFRSIVMAVKWGRSVFANIRKFLQFQLTVNVVCLVAAFVGALVGGHEPLTLMQLLWVNLIMDTMGALALATEDPSDALLLEKPHAHERLITNRMWKHILVQGMYQLFWMMFWLYYAPTSLNEFKVISDEDYYLENCVVNVMGEYGLANSSSPVNGAQFYCGIMNYCGFPQGEGYRQTPQCPLYANWTLLAPNTSSPVPGDQKLAVCYGNSTGCTTNSNLNTYNDYVNDQMNEEQDHDYELTLSMLFNSFIMAQVANEICARRINDEINIFENILQGPIFICVILITLGFQAIIINFLGFVFKCVPLNGWQWGISIAIGIGAIPISIATRLITKLAERFCCGSRRRDMRPPAPHVAIEAYHQAAAGPSEVFSIASKTTPLKSYASVDQ